MTPQEAAPILRDAWVPYLTHDQATERANNIAMLLVEAKDESQAAFKMGDGILVLNQRGSELSIQRISDIVAAGIWALRKAGARLPLRWD